MKKGFYVTTPIYYINAAPHIGHTLTTVVGDVIARYHRLKGEEVFSLTGTDEHGLKVKRAAEEANKEVEEFAREVSNQFKTAWGGLDIDYDYFIRTTNPEHERLVQKFLSKLRQTGAVYQDVYEGLYCIGCEKFLTQSDLVEGHCPLHPPEKTIYQKEKNYFFRLSQYAGEVKELLESDQYKIIPKNRKQEVLARIDQGVEDISISREKLEWGVKIPWDPSQTTYVWIDALLNYWTSPQIVGRSGLWPPNLHVIGKEIAWFHTVIWPALLLAVEEKLPREIFIHSFYTVEGGKMSKSLGNVISPGELIDRYGVDGARYLVAKSLPYSQDSDISLERLDRWYNADLANGLGNLVARVLTMTDKYFEGRIPKMHKHPDEKPLTPLIKAGVETWKKYDQALKEYRLNHALASVWELIGKCDKAIDQKEPWVLAQKGKGEELEKLLFDLLEDLHQIAWMVYPFMPETAKEMGQRLGVKALLGESPLAKGSWTPIEPGTRIQVGEPLFPKI